MNRSSLQLGQSSQPSPDPVRRTAAPVTTITISNASATTVMTRYRSGEIRTLRRLRENGQADPRYVWRIDMPPSTGMIAPLRKLAAGRHRLSVIWATSSGSP